MTCTSPKIQRACAYCGSEFSIAEWDAAKRPAMFCSAVCRNKARTKKPEDRKLVERTCAMCSKAFRLYEVEIKRGGGIYCSRTCYDQDLTPLADRFWPKVSKTETCWLWTGANSGRKWPYGLLGTKRGGPLLKAHHVSWEMHYGPVPIGKWVLHKCDVTLCVRPDHLFIGTAAINTADMVIKGRCATEKLTQEEVDQIRSRYAPGKISMAALGEQYGVSQGAIWFIVHGRSWRHRRRR